MALPGRTEDGRQHFLTALEEVVRTIGLDVAAEAQPGDQRGWDHRARAVLREACRRGVILPPVSFEALMKAAVSDPDPSFNRHFVEPALNAFGRRRVRSALLDYLRTGTDQERAGSARAWYWSALPLRLPQVVAQRSGARPETAPDEPSAMVREWHETALREFVNNDHVDVRRCILPGLSLRQTAYPQEMHDLVDAAVAIARAHPDEYIRHRVEHQVRV